MMKRTIVAIFLLGCTERPPAPPPAAAPAAPALSPGVDLAGPVSVAPRAAPARKEVKPLDLGADREPVKIAVPEVPRGGAVTFQFAEGRQAWVARIPEAQQLPA